MANNQKNQVPKKPDNAKPTIPSLPKKPSKADKFKRSLVLYMCVPVVVLIFAFLGRPEQKPVMMMGKDGKKEKLSKKHMPKQQFDQNEDAFEKFWTPEQKVFTDFVQEAPRTMDNAVLAVVYKNDDSTCKKLAKQLSKLMNINNEFKLKLNNASSSSNMTVVGLDEKVLSAEFKAQQEIASYPTVLLFASSRAGKTNPVAQQYSGLPLVRDAVKRLKGWLETVDFENKESAKNSSALAVPEFRMSGAEKEIKRAGVLNAASNAHVLFACSKKLLQVLEKNVEETAEYKQFLIEDSENEEMNNSEYFFTRYVRQDSMLPSSIVDAPITKSFEDEEDATNGVITAFRQLQVPVFSRLYPEALDSHLSLSPVLIVANQAIMAPDVLGNFAAAFEKFQHSIQFVYMYPADSPKDAKNLFGFSYPAPQNGKGMQVSLYTPGKDFIRFLGNLSDAKEFTGWVVKNLEKWRREGGVDEEEEEEEEEAEK